MKEFLMSLPMEEFEAVRAEARKRGVSVQEYLRNVVIPAWLEKEKKFQ